MCNAFINLEPVQRSEYGCDMRRFGSFNHSACKTVLNLLEISKRQVGDRKVVGSFSLSRVGFLRSQEMTDSVRIGWN